MTVVTTGTLRPLLESWEATESTKEEEKEEAKEDEWLMKSYKLSNKEFASPGLVG